VPAPLSSIAHKRSGRWPAGQSRKPETGEKNRQDKRDGHSKKPPSFHNAGVSIIHCLSLLLADFTAENGAPVRSFRLWDYGPRGRPTEVLTSKAEGRVRQPKPCRYLGKRAAEWSPFIGGHRVLAAVPHQRHPFCIPAALRSMTRIAPPSPHCRKTNRPAFAPQWDALVW